MSENDGQNKLIQYLDKIDNSIEKLEIKEPLNGDLDLSVINEGGRFPNLKHILMNSNDEDHYNITSVVNIPEGIETFEIKGNSLRVLPQLPSSLKKLNVSRNMLTYIDLDKANKLESLNCSYNVIESINNLPTSLLELIVNNNSLKKLDLHNATKLESLNCSNNASLILENIPESLDGKIICENSPFVKTEGFSRITPDSETKGGDIKQERVNYIEAVNDYFKLKNKYETDNMNAKKKVYTTCFKKGNSKKACLKMANNVKYKCVKCERPVGTIFSNKNRRYTAVCGDKVHPCGLNIEIFRGDFVSDITASIKEFFEYLNENKEDVIIQKMDTLFSYISEETSMQKFKEIMKEYSANSDMYHEYLKKYDNLFHAEFRKEAIKDKVRLINNLINGIKLKLKNYKVSNNIELLKSAMDTYVKDLMPEINNLRMKKYDIMEMNDYQLYQKDIDFSKIEEYFGERPNVISYKV